MARTPNAVATIKVNISTTQWASDTLDSLAMTGRFGKNATEVADELLRMKLREVEQDGWLEMRRRPQRGVGVRSSAARR